MTSPTEMTEIHPWLIQAAGELRAASHERIDLTLLLRRLDVTLTKNVVGPGQNEAETRKVGNGKYKIFVNRKTRGPAPLSPNERFNVAHELAHVLIDSHFAARPGTTEEHREFEELCDAFAGALLVPDALVHSFSTCTAAESLNRLAFLTEWCQVPFVIVARRTASLVDGCAFLYGYREESARDGEVLSVSWSASSVRGLQLPEAGGYLSHADPVGSVLLSETREMATYRLEHGTVPSTVAFKNLRRGFPGTLVALRNSC